MRAVKANDARAGNEKSSQMRLTKSIRDVPESTSRSTKRMRISKTAVKENNAKASNEKSGKKVDAEENLRVIEPRREESARKG